MAPFEEFSQRVFWEKREWLFLRRTLMLAFGSVKMVCENGCDTLKYVG